MTEFMFMAFVAFIILFVAIQMAALGREAMALGELNYQVTRWATNPGNNNLKDVSGNRSTARSAPTWRISSSGATVSSKYLLALLLLWRRATWVRLDMAILYALAPRQPAESASR